jgi:hypothetical protein
VLEALTQTAVTAAVGDLVGNWSWTVWLLIPLAVGLALLTALALGPHGEPTAADRSERGVSRFLAQRPGSGSGPDKEAS